MKKLALISLLYIFAILPLKAEELSFNNFLSTTLTNSYKLKISQLDTQISKKGINEARSDYFPTINAFATTERYNDLTNGTSQITAVGNEILLNRDYYQDMAALGLSYNVFDFGIRRKKLDIAKADNKQRELLLEKDTKDLKLDTADLYGETLNFYKQSKIKQETLSLQKELTEINKQLRTAGKKSEIDVVNSEIAVSETQTELDEIDTNLAKKLTEISFYTNKDYDKKTIVMNDFPKDISTIKTDADGVVQLSASITSYVPEESVDAKIYDLEIQKKQKEYEIQKKYNYPKLRFDTRYNFYGSDVNSFWNGVDDISQRSFSLRLSLSFVLFDGLKNINTISKKKMEVEKAKIEKQQQLAELKKKYDQIQLDVQNARIQSQNNEKTLTLVNKNLDMLKRLHTNGIVEKASCIEKQLELLEKKQKLEQNKIKYAVSLYKLHVIEEEL